MNIYKCKFNFDNGANIVKKEAYIINKEDMSISEIRFAIKNKFEDFYDETAYDIEIETISSDKDMIIIEGPTKSF